MIRSNKEKLISSLTALGVVVVVGMAVWGVSMDPALQVAQAASSYSAPTLSSEASTVSASASTSSSVSSSSKSSKASSKSSAASSSKSAASVASSGSLQSAGQEATNDPILEEDANDIYPESTDIDDGVDEYNYEYNDAYNGAPDDSHSGSDAGTAKKPAKKKQQSSSQNSGYTEPVVTEPEKKLVWVEPVYEQRVVQPDTGTRYCGGVNNGSEYGTCTESWYGTEEETYNLWHDHWKAYVQRRTAEEAEQGRAYVCDHVHDDSKWVPDPEYTEEVLVQEGYWTEE